MFEPWMIPVWLLLVTMVGTIAIITVVKVLDARPKLLSRELDAAQQANHLLQMRIGDLESLNQQLRTQVDWHQQLMQSAENSKTPPQLEQRA